MRKALMVAGSALAFVAISATVALADSGLPHGNQPNVEGKVVHPASSGGLAFTGANIALWAVAALVIAAVGVTLFVVGRRRATAAG
jgi:hypothetical protein